MKFPDKDYLIDILNNILEADHLIIWGEISYSLL